MQGGKIGMLYALEQPTSLDKLIVVDIAPKKYVKKDDGTLDNLQLVRV